MRYGSVCSGIEAASVAWMPLGWDAAWFSEIEPFPCQLLAHHYPDVPNLGDMTTLPELIEAGEVEAPDVLCGGTPCQSFSVAGKRLSLADKRGNLTLTFCEIADAIDAARFVRGEQPAIIFWENVPGIFSAAGNAFGCFLAQLCGGSEPLDAPNGWTASGCVSGPRRTAAWRVLDAQYFGVAQRRKRVFVVASARDDIDPAKILFEFGGVRRDFAPSREAREGVTGAFAARTERPQPVVMAHGQAGAEIAVNRSPTLTCNHEQPIVFDTTQITSPQNRSNPKPGDPCHSLAAGGHVPIAIHPHCIGRAPGAGPQGKEYMEDGSAYCLDARGAAQALAYSVAVEDVAPTLASNGDAHSGFRDEYGLALSPVYPLDLRNALRDPEKQDAQNRQGVGCGDDGDPAPSLTAAHVHGVAVKMQVRRLTPVECERLQGFPDGYTAIPVKGKPAADSPRYKALGNSWAVPVVQWIGDRIDADAKEAA
jgi:DNA (cytosine-5)-methyltransferase 1